VETLTIGELAARSGVAPSALRYYERLGLIRAARLTYPHESRLGEAVGGLAAPARRADPPAAWAARQARRLHRVRLPVAAHLRAGQPEGHRGRQRGWAALPTPWRV